MYMLWMWGFSMKTIFYDEEKKIQRCLVEEEYTYYANGEKVTLNNKIFIITKIDFDFQDIEGIQIPVRRIYMRKIFPNNFSVRNVEEAYTSAFNAQRKNMHGKNYHRDDVGKD